MRCISISAVALSLMFAGLSAAQASAIDQFKSFVVNTKTAKGEFSQTQVKMVSGKAQLGKTASGVFKFARPGKFMWSYLKPYEQVLQADGDKLYMYDKDLNQVTIKALGNAIGSSPAAILFGSVDLDKNFTLKDAGLNNGIEWLEAIPKEKDSQFELIRIGMKDGLPVGMELRDSFGQISTVNLNNFERNPNFSADHFKFVVPKGADVNRL
ncbi:outer membrane lipoprotein chaperone LolA [Undibacterium sp. Di24W]|uniref:outer membrane lipoprotein chaperone LolA n=1 Tax=Undibacterium sp. Di24W TaxID=3413033 RepID=UPI003BF344EB